MPDADERYWREYDGLQYAKHVILREYLGGWFPKLSLGGAPYMLYVDCHAGRGRHSDPARHPGSPLVALHGLLNHRAFSRMTERTRFVFVFFERDETSARSLQAELAGVSLHPSVSIHRFTGDYEGHLRPILARLQAKRRRLPPAFFFLDPFGFDLSMELVNRLLEEPHAEVLVTFMLRYVTLAALRDGGHATRLDKLFGCTEWREARARDDFIERSTFLIRLFAAQLKARWVSYIVMRAKNGTTKYVLFHATSHPAGRRLMKDVLWKVDPFPAGHFAAWESRVPGQEILLKGASPDLRPLRAALLRDFAGRRVAHRELKEWLLDLMYREPHLNTVLRELVREGSVALEAAEEIHFSANPTFLFPASQPVEAG
ncbi:MAG: three-Cys-motif partner protein TcmP [Limnochordaceae bacterium]|nr:three-Cys-motif partner protein TcmP [Limnochordaceae bacterium]